MATKPTPTRYTTVAIILHWLIALCVFGLLGMGTFMTWAPPEMLGLAAKFNLYQWHKSFGALIFILMALRLLWRLTHTAPALPTTLKPWERLAAHITHYGLYVLLILMPLTGWAVVSTAKFNVPTFLFQTVYVPHIGFLENHPDKIFLGELTVSIHGTLAGLIVALMVLHIGGALKHHFKDRDDVLRRMLPKRKP